MPHYKNYIATAAEGDANLMQLLNRIEDCHGDCDSCHYKEKCVKVYDSACAISACFSLDARRLKYYLNKFESIKEAINVSA